ncbi:hypothetical protein [Dysgonomonas sp.]
MTLSNQNISLAELLSLIPDGEIERIAVETKVDYCTKRLGRQADAQHVALRSFKLGKVGLKGLVGCFDLCGFQVAVRLRPSSRNSP